MSLGRSRLGINECEENSSDKLGLCINLPLIYPNINTNH